MKKILFFVIVTVTITACQKKDVTVPSKPSEQIATVDSTASFIEWMNENVQVSYDAEDKPNGWKTIEAKFDGVGITIHESFIVYPPGATNPRIPQSISDSATRFLEIGEDNTACPESFSETRIRSNLIFIVGSKIFVWPQCPIKIQVQDNLSPNLDWIVKNPGDILIYCQSIIKKG